ncbi:MAG: FAD-dependent oxidoreductase [bacterium]
MKNKVAIIGSGPAGYSAALYTSRADLKTTIFAGQEPGGQLMKTTEIENFPGTPKGTTGPQLMMAMQDQATRFGGELVFESVENIVKNGVIFTIKTESNTYNFDAVILAMGASPRMLGIGEEKYWGKGLSTCAVCDAAFYRDKITYVVGGGDSAIEDAVALSKFAKEVTLIVRGEVLRASKPMQKRLLDSKVVVRYQASIKDILGESKIEKLVLDVGGVEKTVFTDGLFLAIGHVPATKFLADSGVELDELGYVKTGGEYPTMTAVPGIFAGGDCVDHRYRQAAVAAGSGVMTALDCEKWLENK